MKRWTMLRNRLWHFHHKITSFTQRQKLFRIVPEAEIKRLTNVMLRYAGNVSDNPIIPLSSPWRCHWYFNHNFFRFNTFPLLFFRLTEQEPTSSDSDSDEEADLVLSLETETGLLTNQHTKGMRKLDGKMK